MNRKIRRILRPGMGIYFVAMLGFSLMALLMDQPMLAVIEGAITAILYSAYLLVRKLRHRNLLNYLKKCEETVEYLSLIHI